MTSESTLNYYRNVAFCKQGMPAETKRADIKYVYHIGQEILEEQTKGTKARNYGRRLTAIKKERVAGSGPGERLEGI